LQSHPDSETIFAAKLYDPESGRSLRVYTTQPGIQIYTANYWNGTIKGSHNNYYQKHGAVALETQSFPDSPNHPSFPNTILHPGEKYQSRTVFEFGLEKIAEHSNEMKGVR
jgi:aldose 1-epimerase